MQEGVKTIGELVVAGAKAAELLEAIGKSFNEVARLVALPVVPALCVAVAARRNDGFGTGGLDGGNQGIAVVALVGNDSLRRDGLDQGSALGDIGDLARRQNEANRITQRIDAGMDLRGQSTSRAADRLIATVFLGAPAACWWARTMVASMKTSSRSAPPYNVSATRCQTPYVSQRANRTYTECQLPHSLGKSRQGQPVRAMYSTASTNRRLSAARPPLSVGLPGSKYAIRSHCVSLNIRRSMFNVQISGCEHKSATVNRS